MFNYQIYESDKAQDRFLAESFLLWKIAAVKRQIDEIDNDISLRQDILSRQRENHEDHVSVIKRYRNDALLHNSSGQERRMQMDGILSGLRTEGRGHELGAWRDAVDLRRERRKLIREYMMLLEKWKILSNGSV